MMKQKKRCVVPLDFIFVKFICVMEDASKMFVLEIRNPKDLESSYFVFLPENR